ILQLTQLPHNLTLNPTFDELQPRVFIRKSAPYNPKKRDRLYQLVDFYTLFYLRFVEDHDPVDGQQWLNAIDHPSRRAWSGYTFERVCWYHLPQIKQALGIAGVYSQSSNWRNTEAQIDLLIDRRDQVINVCEMKFSIAPFTITKQYAEQLLAKVEAFRSATQTNKALYLTFLTTKGLVDNNWSKQLAQYSITMDALFE
ncbi:MAG: ATP-binding protein, partial [Bacteroidota bacterium]